MLGWKKTDTDTENMEQTEKMDRRHEYFVITLRFLAAAYILYMGFLALRTAISGDAGIPLLVAVIVALVFLAAALGILMTTWRAWKKLKRTTAEETMKQQEGQRSAEALMESSDSGFDEGP